MGEEVEILEYQTKVEPLGADLLFSLCRGIGRIEYDIAIDRDGAAIRLFQEIQTMIDSACPFSREKEISVRTFVAPKCFSIFLTSKSAMLCLLRP